MPSLTPVLLTEKSTQKLPRPLLLFMLIAYVLCGIIGKTPWRGEDAIAFGMALSFSQHMGVDSLQMVANAEVAQYGPIWFALLGICIRFLPFLPAPIAAAIPVIASLLLAVYALWQATFYLAKTSAAQPLNLALGGQPQPIAYARAVADGAVLLLLATIGIALPLHEMTALSFQFTVLSTILAGLSLSLHREHKPIAYTVVSVSLIVLGASIGLHSTINVCVWLLLLMQLPAWRFLYKALPILLLSAVLGVSLPFFWAYYLNQTHYIDALWAWNLAQFGWISYDRLKWLLSNLWFTTWPALPFALVALWRWRKHWHTAHIGLGLSFISVMLCSLLTHTQITQAHLMAVVPGALVLAAFLLPALPRIWMNAIDWFGIMALSFSIALCWLMWVAMTFGWPADLSRNIMRLAPDLNTNIRWFNVLVASLATLLWLFVVRWRALSAKTVIWRAAVIWSAGSLTVWVLIGTLFMPWLNHVKTYKPVALALKAAFDSPIKNMPKPSNLIVDLNSTVINNTDELADIVSFNRLISPIHLPFWLIKPSINQTTQTIQPACISLLKVGLAQRAILAYFSNLNFEQQSFLNTHQINSQSEQAPLNIPPTVACNWILEYTSLNDLFPIKPTPYLNENSQAPKGHWVLRWEGRRFIEKDERFRLYQRIKTTKF
jgi:hypothetical protein